MLFSVSPSHELTWDELAVTRPIFIPPFISYTELSVTEVPLWSALVVFIWDWGSLIGGTILWICVFLKWSYKEWTKQSFSFKCNNIYSPSPYNQTFGLSKTIPWMVSFRYAIHLKSSTEALSACVYTTRAYRWHWAEVKKYQPGRSYLHPLPKSLSDGSNAA